MAYTPQNFEDGKVLKAEELNHIEAGIAEIEKNLKEKQPAGNYIETETDPTVPSWAKEPTKPTYTASEVGARPATWTPSAEDVGADPSGTAETKVSEHNTNAEAHNDIRLLISGLTTRLNALANSDDTTLDQMAEVVAYIKSNRTLIESVTTDKVNVTDIINNLTTNVADKPLSAAQGVVLKNLIDTLQTAVTSHTSDSNIHITAAERTAWNAKANKATTLAGYGITDGATKEDFNGLSEEIANKIGKDKITSDAGESEDLVMTQKGVTELVNNALGTGGGGGSSEYETVDNVEEMTDTSKQYILRSTGTLWAYRDKTVDDIPNQFVASEAKLNHRISGGGIIQSGYNGMLVTNPITVPSWANPYTVKLSGISFAMHSSLGYYIAVAWRDSSDNHLYVNANPFPTAPGGGLPSTNENGEYVGNIYNSSYTNAAQVRFSICVKDGTAITAADIENLFIEFVPKNGTKVIQEWQDTGIVPEDTGGDSYVDLLIKINENKARIEELEEQVGTSPSNSGAVWYAVGDSITKGLYSTSATEYSQPVEGKRWVDYVAQYNGYNLTNLGISGSGFVTGTTFRTVIDQNDFSNVDLVTIMLGINDWKNDAAVNKVGTMDDDISTGGTIVSELRYGIEKIIGENPYCKIILITPLNAKIGSRGTEATNWAYGFAGTITPCGSLKNFSDKLKEVCEYYGIQVVDMTNSSIVNRKSITTVLPDGIHPNLECYEVLGKELARRITFA